jgi:hypothetical protein
MRTGDLWWRPYWNATTPTVIGTFETIDPATGLHRWNVEYDPGATFAFDLEAYYVAVLKRNLRYYGANATAAGGGGCAMSEPSPNMDLDQALADLRELRELAAIQNFDLFEFLRDLDNRGTSLFQINNTSAIGAGDLLVSYQLADEALVCLAALRARNVKPVNVESCFSHGTPSPEGEQLTPDARKAPDGGDECAGANATGRLAGPSPHGGTL